MPEQEDAASSAVSSDTINLIFGVLLDIATQLDNVRSHWDADDVDGEAAFFASTAEMAEAIRSAIRRAKKLQEKGVDHA